jgi:hypothetical protein
MIRRMFLFVVLIVALTGFAPGVPTAPGTGRFAVDAGA